MKLVELIVVFPPPLEVTGVSYTYLQRLFQKLTKVSVPSRGHWGVLQIFTELYI